MKAFFIGLLFIIISGVLAVVGVLLYPLMSLLAMALYFITIIAFGIFAIWLLGKLILLVWETLRSKKKAE
jgi:hypothetical protein